MGERVVYGRYLPLLEAEIRVGDDAFPVDDEESGALAK